MPGWLRKASPIVPLQDPRPVREFISSRHTTQLRAISQPIWILKATLAHLVPSRLGGEPLDLLSIRLLCPGMTFYELPTGQQTAFRRCHGACALPHRAHAAIAAQSDGAGK